jgi:hypothetical protein
MYLKRISRDENLKAWIENGDQLMPAAQRRAGRGAN